jgi:hypothetical protein
MLAPARHLAAARRVACTRPGKRDTTLSERLADQFARVLQATVIACRDHYGHRLVSVAVFGSVGRGTARPDSDLDLLIVADALPNGRVARSEEFQQVEAAVADALESAREGGVSTSLSPVFKTPAEIDHGSPLLFDMVEDARILYDRDGYLDAALGRLRDRLQQLGARRIWRGNAWFWDLKPDYKPGEVFEI